MNRLDWLYSLIDKASGPAKKIADAFKKIDQNARAADGARNLFGRMGAAARSGAKAVRGAMGTVAASVGIATAALAGLGAVGIAGGKSILDAMGLKEQTLVSFRVTLKTQGLESQAEKIYNDVQRFAAVTPFDTGGVIAAAKQILAAQVPVKKLNNYLTVAGNLASGMGVGLQDALSPILRLRSGNFGEAFERLREMGISRPELEGAGLKFDKSGSYKGSVQDALTAVSTIVTTKFGGMMDAQGKTLFGLVSTIASRPFELFTSIDAGSSGPLGQVKRVLLNLSALTDFTKAPGSRIQKQFAKSVTDVFGAVFGQIGDLTDPKNAARLVDNIVNIVKQIGDGFIGLIAFTRAAVPVIQKVFGAVAAAIDGVVKVYKFLEPALPFLVAFFAVIGGGLAIVAAVGAISSLVAGVAAAGGVFAAVVPIIGSALALIGGPVTLVIAAVAGIAALLITNWGAIGPFLANVWTGIVGFLGQAVNFALAIPAQMMNIGRMIVEGLAMGILNNIMGVVKAVASLGDTVVGGLKGILGIASPSKVARGMGRETGRGFGLGLDDMLDKVSGRSIQLGAVASGGLAQGISMPAPIPARTVSTRPAARGTKPARSAPLIGALTINATGTPDMTKGEYQTMLENALLSALERAAVGYA